MKIVLSVSLLFSIAAPSPRAEAQVLCALAPEVTPYDPMADMPPAAGAQAELKKAKALLCPKGCGKVLLFANSTTPNAVTVTDGLGVSKIVYNPTFVSAVHTTYGPNATLGIMAHELGHHLESTAGNRASWMNGAWDSELRADAWAGCALAKAELRPSVMQAALRALATYPSAGHPPWTAREPVLQAGYTQCGGGRMLSLASATDAAPRAGKKGEAKGEARAGAGGCASDSDCRNGRTCVSGRCGPAPEHLKCGKDTDCPEPQECDSSGACSNPASPAQQTVKQADQQSEWAEQKEQPSHPSEAPRKQDTQLALKDRSSLPSAPAKDVAPCAKSCDETRDQCVETAQSAFNRCLAPIQAEPNYQACSCPTYPTGNYGCYRVCTAAYERGKSCWPAEQVRQCKTAGERCRSQCP